MDDAAVMEHEKDEYRRNLELSAGHGGDLERCELVFGRERGHGGLGTVIDRGSQARGS